MPLCYKLGCPNHVGVEMYLMGVIEHICRSSLNLQFSDSEIRQGFTSAKCKMVWKSQLNNSSILNSYYDPSGIPQMLPKTLNSW
jgi:hypothetical protein